MLKYQINSPKLTSLGLSTSLKTYFIRSDAKKVGLATFLIIGSICVESGGSYFTS